MSEPCSIRPLEWDTGFFGLKMGAVELPQISDSHLTEEDWQSALDEARRRGYRFLYCPIDSTRQKETRILTKSGGLIGDILLTFHYHLTPDGRNVSEKDSAGGYSIVEAKGEDLPALQEIAADSFVNSRFYQDPRFDRGKASGLYQNWLAESFQKEKILAVQSDLGILGFASFGFEPEIRTLIIRLLAAKPQERGRGVGGLLITRLLAVAAANGCQTLSVGTQMNNYGAVRFYEKMGFRLANAKLRFHFWLDEYERK